VSVIEEFHCSPAGGIGKSQSNSWHAPSTPAMYCLLFLQLHRWGDCSCSLRNSGSSSSKALLFTVPHSYYEIADNNNEIHWKSDDFILATRRKWGIKSCWLSGYRKFVVQQFASWFFTFSSREICMWSTCSFRSRAVCKLVFHIQFKGNLHVVNLFIQE